MFLSVILGLSSLWASEIKSVSDFKSAKCQNEFQKTLKDKSWDKEIYRQHVSDSFQQTVYRNLSKQIGQWIDIKLDQKNSPVILHLNNASITQYSFNSNCNLIITNTAFPWHLDKVFSKKMNENWSNEDLLKQTSSGKRGLIYYWSPRFSYSVYDLPRMEKLAQKYGYEFTAVVDPRASSEEVLGALDVMNTQTKSSAKVQRNLASNKYFNRNISTDLYMRNGFNHFPITYIYNNKMIHSRWITGIMTDLGVKNMADSFALELEDKL